MMKRNLKNIARLVLITEFLKQDDRFRKLLKEHVSEVEELLEKNFNGVDYDMESISRGLEDLSEPLYDKLDEAIDRSIFKGVTAGYLVYDTVMKDVLKQVRMSIEPITVKRKTVVEKMMINQKEREIKGLNLSDRIWSSSKFINQTMKTIIDESLTEGLHPVEVAKRLDKYVQSGAKTLVTQYPNMMDRIGDMLPENLSYEALRLARTEMMDAYGAAEKQTAEEAPFSQGIQWSLSNAGKACHICVENANYNGGRYTIDTLPDYPAHPNCMCQLNQITEDLTSFTQRVKEWHANPTSQPDIERWYKEFYIN